MKTTTTSSTGDLWQQLAQSPAQPALWLALAHGYAAEGFPWQKAYVARQALRLDPALEPELQALANGAWQDRASGDALLGHSLLSDATSLAERFSARVQQVPGDWLTWLYLSRLLEMKTTDALDTAAKTNETTHALEQAQQLEPIDGESLHWLGVWRLNAGDVHGAIWALSQLLDIRPVRFGSMMFLGEALVRAGNRPAAEKAFARASGSNNPDFLQMLAGRIFAHNYWQEAISVLQKSLSIAPERVPTLLALARIQSEVYALADCRNTLDRLQALDPDNGDARLLYASLQGRMGDARGHLAHLQAAYESDENPLSRLASSVAMVSLYNDQLTAQEVATLHQRLCEPIEASVAPVSAPSPVAKAGKTKKAHLRVGFVTGDLHRQHPVNIFMLPLLQRLARTELELIVYHTGAMYDEYTHQAQSCVDGWREVATLTDTELKQAIQVDEIDVLVDLAGHTMTHRLGVFAMRAAPVQCTFLGYPHSTGMSAIDWMIGDATVSPAEHAHLFSEGIAQLPGSVFCWAPVDTYTLPKTRPADAPLVFASFNNAMKLSPTTLALWGKVLHAVPDSKLMLKAPSLRDDGVQMRFTKLLAEHGISSDRLILRGPTGLADMMQEYGDVDIALDPTPYNGGTTTLQALWMGVPVVTLLGHNFVSRMGASFLRALGQPDWVAVDETAYVETAVALAADRAKLRAGRATLRDKMMNSALCDMTGYADEFARLIQKIWMCHVGDLKKRLIQADVSPAGSSRRAPKVAHASEH
jgi:protein O-GlcNAc transferase